jgi:hypothetical protein
MALSNIIVLQQVSSELLSFFPSLSLDGYVYLDSLSPHKWTEAVML